MRLRSGQVWLVTILSAGVLVAVSIAAGTWQQVATVAPPLAAAAADARLGRTPAGEPQQAPERRTIEVHARRYTFDPSRIEVRENDVVRIVLTAEDIPHSFTIDEYRIAKRAAPGHPVVFEFRADQVGTFTFYCNLTADEGCKKMRGEFVVTPR